MQFLLPECAASRCLIFKRECRWWFHFFLCRCRNFGWAACRSSQFHLLHVTVSEPCRLSEFTLSGPHQGWVDSIFFKLWFNEWGEKHLRVLWRNFIQTRENDSFLLVRGSLSLWYEEMVSLPKIIFDYQQGKINVNMTMCYFPEYFLYKGVASGEE